MLWLTKDELMERNYEIFLCTSSFVDCKDTLDTLQGRIFVSGDFQLAE